MKVTDTATSLLQEVPHLASSFKGLDGVLSLGLGVLTHLSYLHLSISLHAHCSGGCCSEGGGGGAVAVAATPALKWNKQEWLVAQGRSSASGRREIVCVRVVCVCV